MAKKKKTLKAVKAAATLPDFMPNARKHGVSVRFGFLRIIKAVHNCNYEQAIEIFNHAVASGKIIEIGKSTGGDVSFYKAT